MNEHPILFSDSMIRAILAGTKTQTRRPVRAAANHTPPWTPEEAVLRCPYGAPGDRLWVREAWCMIPGYTLPVYRASWPASDYLPRWSPSIHMPRWASRITLDVLAVRVERLRDITLSGVGAEGVMGWPAPSTYGDMLPWRASFAYAWNAIYAKRGLGWDANPWVWVVEFRRAAK